MRPNVVPAHAQRVLARLRGVRANRTGWDALCPCPEHNEDGDQHASLGVAVGDDGRVLVKCRVGCTTDAVLEAIGLDWSDLFEPDNPGAGPGESVASTVPGPSSGKAGADLCDLAYRLLLEQLPLADGHRQDLRRRGFSDAEIERRGYRTLRNTDRGGAAKLVHQNFGDAVLAVPGFVFGEFGITLHGEATGLLVPVRDIQGRIVALKIRRADEPKYVYLTGGSEGTSPGSRVHVPLGITAPAPVVRVTEGELKADVCVALDGTPTVGIPGVTQWRSVFPLLRVLDTKTVFLAFDAPDVRNKAPVFEQAEALYQALARENVEIEMEVWDEYPQGG